MTEKYRRGIVVLILGALSFQLVQADERVTVDNFSRAETDRTMADYVKLGGFGEFYHIRKPAPIDQQKIVRLNDGNTPYSVTIKEVPVDGFWSITVYGEDNYLAANDLGVNAINNVTAEKNPDGSITINVGGPDDGRKNYIPATKGWNYVFRAYRPRTEVISGKWVPPMMQPSK